MFKKIISSILTFAIVIMSAVLFTGCSDSVKSYALGAYSNGGMALVKDGYMYYIAGGTDKLDSTENAVIKASSIYKRKVDADYNPVEGSEPELVWEGVAGFKNGGLYCFGEYLYFTTPSSFKNSAAETMTDRTSFVRVRLDGKKYSVIYTTETSDDLKYAYYAPTDTELYITILEGSNLYSYDVKKNKKVVISEEATEAVFSPEFGRGNGADPYLFYTTSPKDTYLSQNGNMVYRATPDGKSSEQISSGITVSLEKIFDGYLYYSANSNYYKTTTMTGLDKMNVVSYGKTYKTPFFTHDGGLVADDTDNGKLVYFVWEGGARVNTYTLSTSTENTICFQDQETIYGLNKDKKLVTFSIDGSTYGESKLDDKIIAVSISTSLTMEKVGSYLYYYTETKTTDAAGNELTTWNIASIQI